MGELQGVLRKMYVEDEQPVRYTLNLDKQPAAALNELIGSQITFYWTGKIYCVRCGRSLQKTFGQGFCYSCFSTAPEAAPCIIRPELCEAHLGKGRDVEWEQAHHNQTHKVYLAQASGTKVGVTRETNVPARWIDQGASRAAVLAQVPYRKLAGDMELEMKQYLSDRTDWRQMLVNAQAEEELAEVWAMLREFTPPALQPYLLPDVDVQHFSYPVPEYPAQVSSVKLEELPTAAGALPLHGIRGQYLYFDQGRVLNVRKYSGYEVAFAGAG